jgi:hypothetical protein
LSWNEYVITLGFGDPYEIVNLSSCQTLDANNVVTPVGNGGFGRVRVTLGNVSKFFKFNTTKIGGQSVSSWNGSYVTGSVSKYLYDQVSPYFDATPDVNYYSVYNHDTSTYTRNSACWASAIDISAVAVASSYWGGWTRQRGGTLIGGTSNPQHILIARHYELSIGDQVRFSNSAGTVQTRTIIGRSSTSNLFDLMVCALDQPITIANALKIPGSWIAQDRQFDQYRANWYSGGIAIHTNQFNEIHISTLGVVTEKTSEVFAEMSLNGQNYGNIERNAYVTGVYTENAIPSQFYAMNKEAVPGDSGQPVFILINGEPVLLWVWANPTSGTPTYMFNGTVLNQLIVMANDNAVANGHSRPPDRTMVIATNPTL